MLHGILRFDGHPSVMMRFFRNIEGIGPHIRFLLARILILLDYLNKHYVAVIPFVRNETNGSGGVEGLTWIFSRLSFSSSSLSYVLSSWESLCCLGWIMTALIEPWTWVEHCGSLVG
ncbi:hypothetical protein Tco_0996578 [Tanacetum coccineum]